MIIGNRWLVIHLEHIITPTSHPGKWHYFLNGLGGFRMCASKRQGDLYSGSTSDHFLAGNYGKGGNKWGSSLARDTPYIIYHHIVEKTLNYCTIRKPREMGIITRDEASFRELEHHGFASILLCLRMWLGKDGGYMRPCIYGGNLGIWQ